MPHTSHRTPKQCIVQSPTGGSTLQPSGGSDGSGAFADAPAFIAAITLANRFLSRLASHKEVPHAIATLITAPRRSQSTTAIAIRCLLVLETM